MKAIKGFSGFFIYLALVFTAHFFFKFPMGELTIAFWALVAYGGCLLLMLFPKKAALAIGVALALCLGILLADYGISRFQLSQSGIMTLNEEAEFWVKSVSQKKASFGLAKWVKKEIVNYWGLDYGSWLVYERVSKQVVWQQTPTEESPRGYETMTLLILSALVFLATQILLSRIIGPFGQFVPLVLYMFLWYVYYDLPPMVHGLYAYGLVVYGIIRHYEGMRRLHKNEDNLYYDGKRVVPFAVFSSLVLILGASLVFLILPVEKLNIKVDGAIPNIWGVRTTYDNSNFKLYSLGDTAYLDSSGRLGGSVTGLNEDNPLFWVSVEEPLKRPLYMKAQVKNIYDGSRWSKGETTYRNEYFHYKSIPENAALISGTTGGKLPSDLPSYVKGSVTFDNMETISVMAPLGFFASSLDEKKVYISEENQGFYKGGFFVKFLDQYDFEATQRDFTPPNKDDLQLSETIDLAVDRFSVRVGGLGKTPQEKVALLVQTLAKVCSYSLEVEAKPVRKDFVSDFLLNSREGYCTYFASTLVVMARFNGIPARYVEGFRVDPDEMEEREGKLQAKVTEADAHAWAEVYFEGEGWRVVEATPPYMGGLLDAQGESPGDQLGLEEIDVLARLSQINAGALGSDTDGNGDPSNASGNGENGVTGLNLDDLDANLEEYMREGSLEGEAGYDWKNDPLGREEALSGDMSPAARAAKAQALALEKAALKAAANRARILLILKVFLGALLVVVFGFGVYWWMPVILRFKGVNHGKAVGLIYGLATLLQLTRFGGNLQTLEVEAIFSKANIEPAVKNQWIKLLYDRRSEVNPKLIAEAVNSLQLAYRVELARAKDRLGLVGYWKMRALNRI